MIESFYNSFGFLGALGISVGCFILFLFWISGVAGIAEIPDDPKKNWKLVFGVIIPVYPIVWVWWDMFQQHSEMHHDPSQYES